MLITLALIAESPPERFRGSELLLHHIGFEIGSPVSQ